MSLLSRISTGRGWAASFQRRDFRLLWAATVVQSVGMGMEFVALGWVVFELTDSPFWVGVSSAARMAPFFFLGLVSGAVADRVDRRIFIRWITLLGAAIAGLTGLVLQMYYGPVWPIIALSVGMGCVWAFTMTLRQAYTYDIVGPQAALNGMSLATLSQQIGGVAGSLVAGVVIERAGIANQYMAIGVFYVLALGALMWTREPGQAAVRTTQSVLQNLVGYVDILRTNRILLTLMVLAGVTEIFGFTHQSLLPVFAKDVLGVGAFGLGIMSAFRQGGGIVGVVVLAGMGNFRRKGLMLFIIAGAFGSGEMAFSLGGNFLSFVLILEFINACASAIDTLYRTLMQENVSNEERGRAMGSWVL
ncbi:MAG: MFS transporter, partial [Dehalococcoidia bacterium]|nr:MFS transporter [Dehalococcoidia bacterium]